MGSHVTDWHPGRVSPAYRENYDLIFKGYEIDPCPECTCIGGCDDCGEERTCGQE